MKDHKGCNRTFYRSSKAWYADILKDRVSVNFGMSHEDGGTTGEMTVEWITLGSKDVPQLRSFDDSWSALALFSDLVAEMAKVDDQNITEQQFVDMLLRCGFKDDTPYVQDADDSNRATMVSEIKQLERAADSIRERL